MDPPTPRFSRLGGGEVFTRFGGEGNLASSALGGVGIPRWLEWGWLGRCVGAMWRMMARPWCAAWRASPGGPSAWTGDCTPRRRTSSRRCECACVWTARPTARTSDHIPPTGRWTASLLRTFIQKWLRCLSFNRNHFKLKDTPTCFPCQPRLCLQSRSPATDHGTYLLRESATFSLRLMFAYLFSQYSKNNNGKGRSCKLATIFERTVNFKLETIFKYLSCGKFHSLLSIFF